MKYLICSDVIVDAAGKSRKGETVVFDDPKQERRWIRRGVVEEWKPPAPAVKKAAASKKADT
jgi:hypothetical protein